MTPHQAMYGEKRDISDFKTFSCRAWVYIDKQRREKESTRQEPKRQYTLVFANNMSAWALWIPEDKKIMTSNQVKFSKHEFPFLTSKMVDQLLSDNSTDILYQHASDLTWVPYNKLHVGNFEKVHYDTMSDVVVLKVISKENRYTSAIQGKWLSDKVALGKGSR